MTDMSAYTIRRVASSGCEIRDPGGTVIAWAVDEPWALLIAGMLNRVEAEGLGRPAHNVPCVDGE